MISYADWRQQALSLFQRHIPNDPAAVMAGASLLHALWLMQRGFYQGDDKPLPGRAAATLTVVVDLTFGMVNNAFMQRHGTRVYPLFEAAVRGWISGAYYNAQLASRASEATTQAQYDTILDAQSCVRVYRELSLAIVALATGEEPMPEKAAGFRTEITALMEMP